MSSSTVLRVKRRLEDNPHDALVLMCKRKKTDTEEISPSLFVFCGTVANQETTHVKNIVPKTDSKLKSTSNVQNIIEKLRKERKEQSAISRYEVVNCSRGLHADDVEDQIDLVDLKKANEEDNDIEYAYDLYTSAKLDFDIAMLDDLVSIEHFETDLMMSANRNNEDSTDNEEDDDSNDENNWRNDYPDSELSSINEEDMVQAMKRVDLEDLSSDGDEDKIYDPPGFNDDVTRYGAAYAKYKVKVMAENPDLDNSSSLVHCSKVKDLDEESIDGYKDDSDDGFYYGEDEDSRNFKEQYPSDMSDNYSPD